MPQRIVADRTTVQAGEILTLTFPTNVTRGAAYYLSAWNGDGWDEPAFLLISNGGGEAHCPSCPTYSDRHEPWVVRPIALNGPGPEQVLIPETASPGSHRLCAIDVNPPLCVEFEVLA